jgi:conjugal transfer pilus assembly protein TraF
MRAVSSTQFSVSRSFVEGLKSLTLLSMILKISFFLLFFFLSTGRWILNTASAQDSFNSSHKRPQESSNVNSNNHFNNGWRPQASKLAFFERHAEGWHWYQDSLSESEVKEKKEKPNSTLSPQTPTEKIEAQRKEIETKLHAAIVEPTRENLMAYIMIQKALMDQSQRFSESWQRVVMTTPALDETLTHPVDQSARHVYYDEQAKAFSKHMKGLSQEYGLFFFFRKNCAYCHNFAPIVKRFAQKYGWSVLPISLDGGTLPEFPNARRDNGMATRLQVGHVPALIALHSKTGKLLPLAYGMVSESEIERRIEMLTKLSDRILNKASPGGQK